MMVKDIRDNETMKAVVEVLECNGQAVFQVWSKGREVDKPLSNMFDSIQDIKLNESFEIFHVMSETCFKSLMAQAFADEEGDAPEDHKPEPNAQGFYNLAYTTNEEGEALELKYHFILNILAWFQDGQIAWFDNMEPADIIDNYTWDLIWEHLSE